MITVTKTNKRTFQTKPQNPTYVLIINIVGSERHLGARIAFLAQMSSVDAGFTKKMLTNSAQSPRSAALRVAGVVGCPPEKTPQTWV